MKKDLLKGKRLRALQHGDHEAMTTEPYSIATTKPWQPSLTVSRPRSHGNEPASYSSQEAGFTLIELLMVVIILGILAAVVIPQFSGSTQDAKISALKSNLSSIRSAIELYQAQHDSAYPGADIETQLTQYTKLDGTVSLSKTGDFKYGPYLKQGFPKNPFTLNSDKANKITIDATIADIGTVTAKTEEDPNGWVYVTKTGEFIANTTAYQKY